MSKTTSDQWERMPAAQIDKLLDERDAYKAQRDTALAALRETLDALCNETSEVVDSYWINNVKDKARAAIAASQGSAQ